MVRYLTVKLAKDFVLPSFPRPVLRVFLSLIKERSSDILRAQANGLQIWHVRPSQVVRFREV